VSLERENLLSLQEEVLEMAVTGVPDERWGERPLAIVFPKEEKRASRGADHGQWPTRTSAEIRGRWGDHEVAGG